ncbi:hypothetical protein K1719_036499 [Acacia pycnantha]|nr:hypothetical protein K1719_036499 [Acacia pycnantha]
MSVLSLRRDKYNIIAPKNHVPVVSPKSTGHHLFGCAPTRGEPTNSRYIPLWRIAIPELHPNCDRTPFLFFACRVVKPPPYFAPHSRFSCSYSRFLPFLLLRKMAGLSGFRGLTPKVKNLVVAGGLSAFVLGVYFYTMRAVGGTDELQVAIDKFEQGKSQKGAEASIPSKD